MKMFSLILVVLLSQQPQELPRELRSAQVADPRPDSGSGTIAVAGQAGAPANPSQIPAPQLEDRQIQSGGRMRVQFRDVDLRALLSALAQNEVLNLSIDPTISEMVTVDLDNVTLEEALDAILTPRALQYRIDGNLLRVSKLQMQTRTFSFDYVTTARTLGRSLSANATAGLRRGSGRRRSPGRIDNFTQRERNRQSPDGHGNSLEFSEVADRKIHSKQNVRHDLRHGFPDESRHNRTLS